MALACAAEPCWFCELCCPQTAVEGHDWAEVLLQLASVLMSVSHVTTKATQMLVVYAVA